MTTAEAGTRLQMHPDKVGLAILRGKLKARAIQRGRQGKVYDITQTALEEYQRTHRIALSRSERAKAMWAKRKALIRTTGDFASNEAIVEHETRQQARNGDSQSQQTMTAAQHMLRWWNHERGNVIGEIGEEERTRYEQTMLAQSPRVQYGAHQSGGGIRRFAPADEWRIIDSYRGGNE